MSQFPIKLFEGQINFVKFLRFHPCAEPMPILVETFFPCFLRMVIDLYLIDESDIAMDILEDYPRYGKGKPASRSLRHSFKKEKDGKRLSRKQVLTAPFIFQPNTMALTTFLYNVAAPLEKIGFAFMFYSAVDNFFHNWTSLLVQRGYCSLPALTGPLQRTANPQVQLAGQFGQSISMQNEIQNRASWPSASHAASLPPGTYTALLQMDIQSRSIFTITDIAAQIQEGTHPVGVHTYRGELTTFGPMERKTIFVSATVGSPSFLLNDVWWELYYAHPGAPQFDLHSATISIWMNYEEISY